MGKFFPMKILVGKNIVSINCGESHMLATTADGTLFSWGYNGYGQAGGGLRAGKQPVMQVKFPSTLGPNAKVVDAVGGFEHSLAITCTPKTEAPSTT